MINTGSKNSGGGGNYSGGGVTGTLDFLPHSGLHKLFLCRDTLFRQQNAPDINNNILRFLAATSSTRIDDVTLVACLFACLSPYFF